MPYVISKGGMRAVIWTDVFQSLVMISGMLTILIKVKHQLNTALSHMIASHASGHVGETKLVIK